MIYAYCPEIARFLPLNFNFEFFEKFVDYLLRPPRPLDPDCPRSRSGRRWNLFLPNNTPICTCAPALNYPAAQILICIIAPGNTLPITSQQLLLFDHIPTYLPTYL